MTTTLNVDRIIRLVNDPTDDLPPIDNEQAEAIVRLLCDDPTIIDDMLAPNDEPDPTARVRLVGIDSTEPLEAYAFELAHAIIKQHAPELLNDAQQLSSFARELLHNAGDFVHIAHTV
jgi:hypothetical protein